MTSRPRRPPRPLPPRQPPPSPSSCPPRGGARARDQDGHQDRGHQQRDAGHPEHDRGLARDRRQHTADRRPEHEAAGLRGAIEAEGLALAFRRVRVDEVGASGRVVHRRRHPRARPQDDERHGANDEQGQDREHRGQHQAPDHHRPPGDPIRQPTEERFADQASGRPCRDHDTQGGQVHAVLGEVDRQDREQRTEAEPDGGLGEEERQDRPPLGQPGTEASVHVRPASAGLPC